MLSLLMLIVIADAEANSPATLVSDLKITCEIAPIPRSPLAALQTFVMSKFNIIIYPVMLSFLPRKVPKMNETPASVENMRKCDVDFEI